MGEQKLPFLSVLWAIFQTNWIKRTELGVFAGRDGPRWWRGARCDTYAGNDGNGFGSRIDFPGAAYRNFVFFRLTNRKPASAFVVCCGAAVDAASEAPADFYSLHTSVDRQPSRLSPYQRRPPQQLRPYHHAPSSSLLCPSTENSVGLSIPVSTSTPLTSSEKR